MNTYSAMGMIAAAWLFPTFISFVPIFLGWYSTDKHLEVRTQKSLFNYAWSQKRKIDISVISFFAFEKKKKVGSNPN